MAQLQRELEDIDLRELERPTRQTGPCAMVIFGATGDLTSRLLFPSLYNLVRDRRLSPNFAIVGVAKNEQTADQFRKVMSEQLSKFVGAKFDSESASWLLDRLYYVSGEFHDPATYKKLAQTLAEVDTNHRTAGNYFFYLATSPVFFGDIVTQLGAAKLAEEANGRWRRIVFEKPFGNDLESAKELNHKIKTVLTESQIFRIDHYLGKETVQNILVFRFSNGIFEPVWNRRYVDHMQIMVSETVGVEKRGPYFDMAGTLRDMVPNHLFQLLSLTTMEPPISFNSDAVHDEQSKILHAVQPLADEDVLHCAVRGQYGEGEINREHVPAYRAEEKVPPDSRTETFIALKLMIDNWRWAGVPIYLRTGKRLAKRHTEVSIQFKRAPLVLFRDTPVDGLEANQLVIHIAPDEGISLDFGVKVPGPQVKVDNATMDFDYARRFPDSTPKTGYETLLYDAMTGDQTLFQRADMVEAAWAVVDPTLDVWKALPPRNFPNYAAGSWGPKEADDIIVRDGRTWRRILR